MAALKTREKNRHRSKLSDIDVAGDDILDNGGAGRWLL